MAIERRWWETDPYIVLSNQPESKMEEKEDRLYSLNDYQVDAMSVRLESANEDYAFLGLAGEVGELYSLKAKAIRDGKDFHYDANLRKELGDALWFLAAIATDNGLTLEDVARGNIYKLFSRRERGTLQGSGDNR